MPSIRRIRKISTTIFLSNNDLSKAENPHQEKHFRMACTKNLKAASIFLRLWKFLLMIYSSLFPHKTPEWTFAEDNEVELVLKTGRSLWDLEGTVCLRACSDDAWSRQTLYSRMQHFKVCIWSNTLSDGSEWWPNTFLSQFFNQVEWNYEVYDWELLIVMQALDKWQHYLQGGPFPVTIYSDHWNLRYFW